MFLAMLLTLYYPCLGLDLGKAWLEKNMAEVNEQGDWLLHFEVGTMGIAKGGGIRIQFPPTWCVHPWGKRNLKEIQTTNPELPHYISARTNRTETSFEILIGKEGIDGQQDRFQKVFTLLVRDQALLPGDKVSFCFANTPAPLISETDAIRVAVDPSGNETFIPIDDFPEFTIKSGKEERLLVFLPSDGVKGKPVRLKIIPLDQYNNLATSYFGDIEISCPSQGIQKTHSLSEEDKGVYSTDIEFSEPGIHRILVRDKKLGNGKFFESNPVKIVEHKPELKRFWGDIHSHCGISKDGVGRAETAFSNARDVFCLDFYALTDHSVGDKCALDDWTKGITPEEWELTQKLVRDFYMPHEFVTILGYEWSSPAPYGNNNVYFKTDSAPFFDLKHYPTIQSLWEQLENWEAFTVPHHTGIMWRGINSPFVDWSFKHERLRAGVELYSLHGSSEFFNSSMRYENYDFTPTTSNFGPYYARDGWAAGNYLAAIASSDNHTAHPGQPHGGISCVLAPQLTREAIFDAFMNRRTYATTGARILLDFRINGKMVGERFALSPGEKLNITIEVSGTAPLEYVEIMRFKGKTWQIAQRWEFEKHEKDISLSWNDKDASGKCLYYCRLKQKGKYFERDVMAWSTPIWIGE